MSGSLDRSVLDPRSNFRTTRRATPGASQVRVSQPPRGTVGPSNLSAYGPSTPRGGRASASAPPGATPMPMTAGQRLGHQWDAYWAGQPSVGETIGSIPDFFTGAAGQIDDVAGDVAYGVASLNPDWLPESLRQAYDDETRVRSYESAIGNAPDHLTGYDRDGGARGSGTDFGRGGYGAVRRAAAENAGKVEGLDRDQIMGAVSAAYAGFEADAAQWRAMRDQALADGDAEVASRFDSQIRGVEQQMDDLKREIKVAGDVESWYRANVEAPFIRAREAAANVDYNPTLDLVDSSVGRIDEEFLASNQRLDEVLRDIGFTPEQQQAMKLGAAEENAVAAAQMDVLQATATRPGFLAEKKNLMFHTADQLRYSELRQSAGNQLVEQEPRKRKLAQAVEDVNFLTKEKADAMARTRRAIERSMGDGPKVPDRETITQTAMETMLDSLAGDLPPGQRQAYLQGAWELINAGFDEISDQNIISWYQQGLVPSGPEVVEAIGQIQARFDAGDITRPKAVAMQNQAYLDAFDDEDRVIFQSLFDTYRTAWAESEQIIKERSMNRGSGTRAGEGNADPANIAAAKAGEGQYGIRRRNVEQTTQMFKDMGIRVDNGFRAFEENPPEGRAKYSDHLAGGAMDLFLHVNNPDDMAMWRNRVRPILDEWVDSGFIAYYLPPGANDAHRDHAHVSFALPGTNDAEYSTAQHFAGDGHNHGASQIPDPTGWTY